MASRVSELPDALQLRILSFVAGCAPPPPAPPVAAGRAPGDGRAATRVSERARELAAELASRGHASSTCYLEEPAARAIRALAERHVDSGQLRPARVGQSHAAHEDANARADSISWMRFADHVELDPLAASLRELCAASAMDGGEPLELPRSAMLARYPQHSAGYTAHRDASALTEHRRLTAIFYLNEEWGPADGGELVLHAEATPGTDATTPDACAHASAADGRAAVAAAAMMRPTTLRVPPAWNSMCVFESRMLHEVLPNGPRPRLALTTWLQRQQEPPIAPPLAEAVSKPSNAASELPTIFVSVPAYRDPETQHTLHDLFARAAHPDRVSVGLVWQGDTETGADAHCFVRPLPPAWAARVRTHWMHFREARGPTLARALAQRLWRGESHHLQIDSHSRFVPGWDEALLEQLAHAEHDAAARARATSADRAFEPKVIITTYPAWYVRPDLRLSLIHI